MSSTNVLYLNQTKNKEIQLMDRLKQARTLAGVSVAEMAQYLGIVPTAYRKYETGQVSPKISVAKKICKRLDTTLGELFDDEPKPPETVDIKYKIRAGQKKLVIEIENEVAMQDEISEPAYRSWKPGGDGTTDK